MQIICNHCKGGESIDLPAFTENQKIYFTELRKNGGLRFTKVLKDKHALQHEVSKFLASHLNTTYNICHRCEEQIEGENVTCSNCRSLNLNWAPLTELRKSPAFYVGGRNGPPVIPLTSNLNVMKLAAGHYEIYILGGQILEKNGFHVSLSNVVTDQVVKVSKTTGLKQYYQGYTSGELAIIPFHFDIEEFGVYLVEFNNVNSLVIKSGFGPFLSIFTRPQPIENIGIKIERKFS